jgi:RNA recognition motif-containing protein
VRSACRRPVTGPAASFLSAADGKDKDPEMHVTLQLRNLSGSTTEDDLESLFAQVGDVMDVRIVRDRGTGVSRGFGFLTMSAQVRPIRP